MLPNTGKRGKLSSHKIFHPNKRSVEFLKYHKCVRAHTHRDIYIYLPSSVGEEEGACRSKLLLFLVLC